MTLQRGLRSNLAASRPRSRRGGRPAPGSNGFSLIELMAVILLLGIGLTSVSMLFVAGIISSSKSRRISIASDAAQKQMERIRSAGFSGCIVDDEVFTPAAGYTIIEQQADKTGRVGFTVDELPGTQGIIDIRTYDGGSGYYPNLKDVTVTVTWTGGRMTHGSTALRTLVANQP